MTIEIYADIACPWCYIGEARFFEALEQFEQRDDVEVVYRPFQLDPSLPHEPVPLKDSLRQKFGERTDATLRHTASAASKEGLTLNWDDALAVNTMNAHRLLRLALHEYDAATQRKVATKLFEAHFTNGANVADTDALKQLAVDSGMDAERVEAYLASDEGRDEVVQEISRAQSIGVQAVPTFVFNGKSAVQGAQPADVFGEALATIYKEEEGK